MSSAKASTTVKTVDLKRVHQQLYSATAEPAMVDVPALSFLMTDTKGDLGDPDDRAAVQSLFALAYTLRYTLRAEFKDGEAAIAYTVMPLQGRWWTAGGGDFTPAVPRDLWRATMMILQPDAVTPELFAEAAAAAAKRRPDLPVAAARLETFAEGACAQVLHVGPYAQEGPTIEGLHAFIRQQGHTPAGLHHEIYLSDPRRVAPEKLRTIIRQPVSAAAGA
jgi:hypothetical protein